MGLHSSGIFLVFLLRWVNLRMVSNRRQEVYSMQWSVVSVSDFIMSGARRGGPLGKDPCWMRWGFLHYFYQAIRRNESAIVQYGQHTSSKPQVQVFSSSGALLLTIPVCISHVLIFFYSLTWLW